MRRVECKTLSMHRVWFISGFLLAVGLLSGFVWSYGYRQALSQLSEKAEADLELAADRLSTQMQVYQELAVLMAGNVEGVKQVIADELTAPPPPPALARPNARGSRRSLRGR